MTSCLIVGTASSLGTEATQWVGCVMAHLHLHAPCVNSTRLHLHTRRLKQPLCFQLIITRFHHPILLIHILS